MVVGLCSRCRADFRRSERLQEVLYLEELDWDYLRKFFCDRLPLLLGNR